MADKDDETSEFFFMYIHFYAMSGAACIKQPNNLLNKEKFSLLATNRE